MLEARLADALSDSYTLEGEIGRGGMGVVYRARDEKLKRTVAIKVLPPDLAFRSDIRARFLREAETAARLAHPHIVPIHSVGEFENLVYFVMGLVEGESLAVRLRRRGSLSVEEARRIMKEAADALAAAHQQGVIHRDVKPDNILLEGTRGRVMVTDFGIAKALTAEGGTLTEAGVAIGTPAFMSPEQAAGDREIDGRSDVYSLGVVAYQMLTSELPFKAPSVAALLIKQVSERPEPVQRRRRDTPPEFSQIVMRCLEKEPDDRWPTADALRRALETGGYAPPQRPASRVPAPAPSQRPLSRRHRRRVERRDKEREKEEAEEREIQELARKTGEPVKLTRFRHRLASYAAVNGMLILINAVTNGMDPAWSLVVAGFWGFGLAKDYGKLWSTGYSWRDVINRPPAPDAIEAKLGKGASRLPPASAADVGAYAVPLEQARKDREAVLATLERMTKAERQMLPDIAPTVDQLLSRATDLAVMLAHLDRDLDEDSLERIEARIAELETEGGTAEGERRLLLLRQQRDKISQLLDRRGRLGSRFESCVLAMQNVRFDMLRLKSAGVSEALSDLTQATQQARALSRDVDAAIDAAGEVRRITRGPSGT